MTDIPVIAPVIAIDGPAASGKGTLARLLAIRLKWHLLDSGAIYRSLALLGLDERLDEGDVAGHVALSGRAAPLFRFDPDRVQVVLGGADRTAEIRSQQISNRAAVLAGHMEIRNSILQTQRSYRKSPGLVADGRDMATRVFPDALSIYLHASPKVRAQRRALELKERGQSVSIRTLTEELEQRDKLDRERKASPLRRAEGAFLLDTGDLSPEQVHATAYNWIRDRILRVSADSAAHQKNGFPASNTDNLRD